MSLSFPASPTVGQIYNGLVWDGVKWASPQGPAGAAQMVLEVGRAANSASLPAGWNTNIYDTVITDRQSAYSPATGIFTPKQAGLYLVNGTVGFSPTSAGWLGTAIVKNNSLSNPETITSQFTAGNPNGVILAATALIYCNGTTDSIRVQGYLPVAGILYGTGGLNFFVTGGTWVGMTATLLMVGPQGPPGTVGPGGKVLLGSTSVNPANPVASVDFPNVFGAAAQYDDFDFEFYDLTLSAAATMQALFSFDGSTFMNTASSYSYGMTFGRSDNTGNGGGGAIANLWMGLAGAAGNTNSFVRGWCPNVGMAGRMKFCMIEGGMYTSAGVVMFIANSYVNSNAPTPTGAVKGIRFLPSTGTITAGVFNIFGRVPGQRAQ